MEECFIVVDGYSKSFCSAISDIVINNPNNKLPLCGAYVYHSRLLHDGTECISGKYVYGVFLSIHSKEYSDGIFIPLNEFLNYDLEYIKKAIHKYFAGLLNHKYYFPKPFAFSDSLIFKTPFNKSIMCYDSNSLHFYHNVCFKNLEAAYDCANSFYSKSKYAVISKDGIFYIKITTYNGKILYIKIDDKITYSIYNSLIKLEKNGYENFEDGTILNQNGEKLIPVNIKVLYSFDNIDKKMIGSVKKHLKEIVFRSLFMNQISLYTAEVYLTMEKELLCKNVEGIVLSLNDSRYDVFIPLELLSCYSYHEIKEIVLDYFFHCFIASKHPFPDLPLLCPNDVINDDTSPKYGFIKKSLKISNPKFTNFKEAYQYSKERMYQEDRHIYSVISVSGKTNEYFIEIISPEGKHYYINVNRDISLSTWLDLKIYDLVGFNQYNEDNTILGTEQKINPEQVLVMKVFGQSASKTVKFAKKLNRKEKKVS